MAGESWDPPSDAALTTGGVGLSAHILAIRDLAAALAARAADSPWLNGIGAISIWSSSGTWVVPTGVTRIKVTVIGGGGAGGAGIDNNGGAYAAGAGGGGGAGGYTIEVGLVVAETENITVTIGAGGVGGAGAGGNGGVSSLARPASWTSSANGGSGGAAGTASGAAGGAGAVLSAPGFPGGRGEDGVKIGTFQGFSGSGAASAVGGGAPAVAIDAVGVDATVHGAGGSGGLGYNVGATENRAGGDGAGGLILIEY